MNQPRSYTLSQFASMVGNAVRRDPLLQGTWVLAELSDFRVGAGGHCYMELIEKDSRGTTIAKMRANMWANTAAAVMPRFQAATGRNLASGLKVMMYGSATYHPNFGFSFSIADIDPSFTMGDLERLRREILMRLHKEGVLTRNKELPVPIAPQRIAVISSPTAAGYGDFINHLNSSAERFVFYPVLIPALMQGDKTASSVLEALDYIESCVDLWDVVVIIRGGGSTTDLNGFDDYELARRVATFSLPVVVGIGHERDRTVLDDIAAVRCKTPTAVAGWLTDSLREAWNKAALLTEKVLDDAAEIVKAEYGRFMNLEALVPVMVQKRVADHRLRLADIAAAIPGNATRILTSARSKLDTTLQLIPMTVANRTNVERTHLDYIEQNLRREIVSKIEKESRHLESIGSVVSAIDPASTLRRGFSITRIDGKAVTSASEVAEGSVVETTLMQGVIKSRVIGE